jgi:hypothetical protein
MMADESLPKNKQELLSLIEREWSALMDVVVKLDEKRMTAPDAGGWSPKDNLAHLTEWMNILLGYHMDKRPSHEVMRMAPEVTANWDFDEINRLLFERNRERSAEDVLAELKTGYARVIDKIKSTSFADLKKPRWTDDPDSPPLLWAVTANTSEHFAEHRETMEKALAE